MLKLNTILSLLILGIVGVNSLVIMANLKHLRAVDLFMQQITEGLNQ